MDERASRDATTQPVTPTPKEVLSAVQETGFLLEQDVATKLDRLGLHSRVSAAYQDPDEGKSREIDVYAELETFRDATNRTSFGVDVIVECKKTAAPFVVVGRGTIAPARDTNSRWNPPEADFWVGREFSSPVPGGGGSSYRTSPWKWLGFPELPGSLDREEFVGSQLLRMDRTHGAWKATNNQIFDSVVVPMSKALKAFQQRNPHQSGGRVFNKQLDWAHASVSFPVLVTTAELFQIDADLHPYSAQHVPWTFVAREIRTRAFNDVLTMAVVNYESLDEFVTSRVLAFGNAAAEILRLNPTALSATASYDLIHPEPLAG